MQLSQHSDLLWISFDNLSVFAQLDSISASHDKSFEIHHARSIYLWMPDFGGTMLL